jgi:hypothetical protein
MRLDWEELKEKEGMEGVEESSVYSFGIAVFPCVHLI